MNAAAHDIEVAVDRPLMPRFHGAFSVGGLCGAGLGALAAALGLAVGVHLALAGAAVVVTALVAARHLPDVADAPSHVPVDQAPRRVITPRLVLLGLLTACTTLGEGAAADWGAIFFTDERQRRGVGRGDRLRRVRRGDGDRTVQRNVGAHPHLAGRPPCARPACWPRSRCSPWSPSTRRRLASSR